MFSENGYEIWSVICLCGRRAYSVLRYANLNKLYIALERAFPLPREFWRGHWLRSPYVIFQPSTESGTRLAYHPRCILRFRVSSTRELSSRTHRAIISAIPSLLGRFCCRLLWWTCPAIIRREPVQTLKDKRGYVMQMFLWYNLRHFTEREKT